MGIFTKMTDVEKLQKKSGNIINVFTRTIVSLKEINEEMEKAVLEKQAIIFQLDMEMTSLTKTQVANSKIINNIENILQ